MRLYLLYSSKTIFTKHIYTWFDILFVGLHFTYIVFALEENRCNCWLFPRWRIIFCLWTFAVLYWLVKTCNCSHISWCIFTYYTLLPNTNFAVTSSTTLSNFYLAATSQRFTFFALFWSNRYPSIFWFGKYGLSLGLSRWISNKLKSFS
jgi:hypothetical protein